MEVEFQQAGGKKISIVIPCYNVERYLDRCIHSLANQTIGIDALQLIFVNDASTDRTGRKLAYWQEKYPGSIEVINLVENRRQGGARNEGMKHITAPFTGFLDSDDWVAPEMFELLYGAMQEDHYDFACCFMKRVFGPMEKLDPRVQEDRVIRIQTMGERKGFLMDKLPGGIVCKLYRTDFLRQNAVPFPEHISYEDNYWWALLALKTSFCKVIGKELYYYFVNPNSTILSQDSSRHFDRLDIEEMKIQEYKRQGIFETYYREFEFQFLRMYYINSLHTFFLRISDMGCVPFGRMQARVKEYFPDYLANPYIGRFNALQMELLKTLELALSKEQWQLLADHYRGMMDGREG